MPRSSKIEHPFPAENEDPFYSSFESFVSSLDEADYAARDTRNIAITGGGTVQVSESAVVSWTQDFKIHHALTGFSGILPADSEGVELADGEMGYVEVVHGPAGEYDLTLKTTTGSIPNSSKSFVFLYRDSGFVWIRPFGIVKLGKTVGQGGGGGGGGLLTEGDELRAHKTLATSETVGIGSYLLGRTHLNPDDYDFANLASQTFRVRVDANVTQDGEGSNIELFDADSATTVFSTSVSSDQPGLYTGTFSPSSGTSTVYELNAGMNSGTTGSLQIWHAEIEIVSTF